MHGLPLLGVHGDSFTGKMRMLRISATHKTTDTKQINTLALNTHACTCRYLLTLCMLYI